MLSYFFTSCHVLEHPLLPHNTLRPKLAFWHLGLLMSGNVLPLLASFLLPYHISYL